MTDFTQLSEVYRILSVHPSFALSGFRSLTRRPRLFWLGRLVKEARLLRFGAEFTGGLTLLGFRLQQQRAREFVAYSQWYAPQVRAGWTVFLHFVNEQGDISFQGDHSLRSGYPDPLGFLYFRRTIHVPSEALGGGYRIRLGVWSPKERMHLELRRYTGCIREARGWCHNAVLLGSFDL